MSKYKLAVIIPAYKSTFLHETLESIANQSSDMFTLYIGDDASPHDLYEIIEKFEERIDIIYYKFTQNYGNKDLVAHWERCIALTKDEDWLWLFSDDDLMSPNCVDEFYKTIEKTNVDLLHFNTNIIDNVGRIKYIPELFPNNMTISEFYQGVISLKFRTSCPEYIFTRQIYIKEGGFVKFDLAWGSDTATWMTFSKEKGIYTMQNNFVYWRNSGENISTKLGNRDVDIRKLDADTNFILWSVDFFKKNNIEDYTTINQKINRHINAIIQRNEINHIEKIYNLYLLSLQISTKMQSIYSILLYFKIISTNHIKLFVKKVFLLKKNGTHFMKFVYSL